MDKLACKICSWVICRVKFSPICYNKPIEYKEISRELMEAIKIIELTDSKFTLRRHMVYL